MKLFILRNIFAKVQEDLLSQETIMGKKPSTKSILLLRQKINEFHCIMWKQKYPHSRGREHELPSEQHSSYSRGRPTVLSWTLVQGCCSLVNYVPCRHGTAQHNGMDAKHISNLQSLRNNSYSYLFRWAELWRYFREKISEISFQNTVASHTEL